MTTIGKKVKVNDFEVKPIPVPKINPNRIKGYELFLEAYCNIFLCAKKKSGKTSALFSILKKCAGENTKILIFASTVFKDANYKEILKYFKKNGNTIIPKTHFIDEDNNELDNLISTLQEEDQEESSDEETKHLVFDDPSIEVAKKEKVKQIAPEYIFVFDDLSTDLRHKSITALVKKNRHFKSKVILSSQALTDLDLQARQQIDYCLLFQGHSPQKLELIHRDLDLSIPFDQFLTLYYNATEEKYHFLYIDRNEQSYRQDFNKLYVIN